MMMSQEPISLGAWQDKYNSNSEPMSFQRLTKHIEEDSASCKVVVDCTASEDVPDQYCNFMGAGVHVITPNKKFGAGPLDRFQQAKNLQLQGTAHFYYEVGCICSASAGLEGRPVLAHARASDLPA